MSKFKLNFKSFHNEVWKKIDGFDNYYISNYGRISNFNYRNTGNRILLKPFITKTGYKQINLIDNNSNKVKKYIHRLVAEAFLPIPNNLSEINHIDEDKLNNKIDNLEWCNREYNINYGTRNERMARSNSKSISQYDQNGNWIATYSSVKEAAKVNNLWKESISSAARGKLFTTGGYIWRYN